MPSPVFRSFCTFLTLAGALVPASLAAQAQGSAAADTRAAQSAAPVHPAHAEFSSAPAGNNIARLSFGFENPALSPSNYTIELSEGGTGHYRSDPGTSQAPDAQGGMPQPFDQEIKVSAALRGQWFATARSHHFFAMACESTAHHVAFTGHKTVAYNGPDGKGACTYNYSQDAQLMKLAYSLAALSFTLEEGRKLRLEYLHDRLSLDAELETLAAAVQRGYAVELENIAPELKSIAGDPAVMQRARARATALLASAPAA